MYYILDESNEPVKVEVITDWLNKFNEGMRRVAKDESNGVSISTVFLGIDHGFGGAEKPVLWETMCFSHNPDYSDYQERYTSYKDALAGHEKAVKAVREGISLNGRKTLKLKL